MSEFTRSGFTGTHDSAQINNTKYGLLSTMTTQAKPIFAIFLLQVTIEVRLGSQVAGRDLTPFHHFLLGAAGALLVFDPTSRASMSSTSRAFESSYVDFLQVSPTFVHG